MNDAAIKNFAINARLQLLEEVGNQMARWAVDDAGGAPATVDVLNGRPLTARERELRAQLLDRCRRTGADQLREQAAYTWFNRFAAIRFMELHDYLPCHLRFFSAADGTFAPQVMDEALRADIAGADRTRIAELVQAGDREALFRYLLLAQCNELADALPGVFGRVDACMELLLPEHLLRQGSVVEQMVTAVPEDNWQRVEVLGWLYQYYNTQLKDDFFKSKRKASAADIGPATQLFTPEWIVRYMVENSLGRLWMLNFPESRLAQGWEYYIAPDAEHEDFARISGPEDITLCDPACGSGHILVYAFELLFGMYAEQGYRERDIPQLILEKNLSGMEIDPRAAQIANLALAMCAREHDRRFFGRGVVADVCVVRPVRFERDGAGNVSELPEDAQVLQFPQLLDALEHLDEIGSLYSPGEPDLQALRADAGRFKAEAEAGDLFKAAAAEKLQQALKVCEALARKFDCVVANPPYMGSSSFSPYMSKWIKKHYPDVKSDLCTCFIQRAFDLVKRHGYATLVTMQSWMFLGSFEKMRTKLIAEHSIVSMAHIGTRGFDSIGGEVVSTTATVFAAGQPDAAGTYLRLVDPVGEAAKQAAAQEAIASPNCPYRYHRTAKTFTQIPGTPIAYWASDAFVDSFVVGEPLSSIAVPRQGLATSDNGRFLRKWWEIEPANSSRVCANRKEAKASGKRWFPIIRGGSYRKWFGEFDEVVDWLDDGVEMKKAILAKYPYLKTPDFVIKNQSDYFKPAVTWSKISSSLASFRYAPQGMLFEVAGACMFANENKLKYLQAFCNTSIAMMDLSFMSPTLNFEVGQIGQLPVIEDENHSVDIARIVDDCRSCSKLDYDSFETSWDFKRHPLL